MAPRDFLSIGLGYSGVMVATPSESVPGLALSDRRLVVIASTMRSGSTLLKALLQEAPDVSRLNEINFQRYARHPQRISSMWQLDPSPILLLKRPAWYHEPRRYPRLPDVAGQKVIVLVRDCEPTVHSLRKMTFGWADRWMSRWTDHWLASRYWEPVTRRLIALSEARPGEVQLIRYEELVAEPLRVTAGLFRFMGSVQQQGVDTYRPPPGNRWRWWVDDNSPRIRSLQVQAPRPPSVNRTALGNWLDRQTPIVELRNRLGYRTGQEANPAGGNSRRP